MILTGICMKRQSRSLRCLVATLYLVCICGRLTAATKSWDGSDGDWNNPAKWVPAGVPAIDDHISVTNGNVSLSSPVVIAGTLTWKGGSLSGNELRIQAAAALTLSGSDDKLLTEVVLVNEGTVNWQGGRLVAYATGYSQRVYITNLAGGTFHVLTGANTAQGYTWSGYGVPEFLFHNAGTLLKDTVTATNQFDGLRVINTGLIDLKSGPVQFNATLENQGEIRLGQDLVWTLTTDTTFRAGSRLVAADGNQVLYQSGSFTFEPGFFFSPTLTNRVTGTCHFLGTINLSHFELTEGAITGGFTNSGTLTWTGGSLNGAEFYNRTNALLEVSGDADKVLVHSLVLNEGTVNWRGGRLVAYATGYSQRVYITNFAGGTFHVLTGANTAQGYTWSGYGVPEFLLHNSGQLIKLDNSTNHLSGLLVINDGKIAVNAGALSFDGGLENHGEVYGNVGLRPVGWVNGLFVLRLLDVRTNHYAIKVTTDFQDWRILFTTNTSGTTLDFADPESVGSPHRFYQAVLIP